MSNWNELALLVVPKREALMLQSKLCFHMKFLTRKELHFAGFLSQYIAK